ncbi:MAG: FecR family protein [Oscillatoria princeps RMCB-10]|nr:FecR family protein [Oscillatoria princeps RMCB-10]
MTDFLKSPGSAILGLSLAAFAVQELNHQALASSSASSSSADISAVEPVRTAPPAPLPALATLEESPDPQSLQPGATLETAQNVQMPASSRFILVEEVRGTVTYGPSQQPVKAGQQLAQGTQVSTGSDSSARLLIDSQIGSVEVAENTTFQVKTLTSGKTALFVTGGRVRLSVSPGARLREAQKSLSGGGGQSVLAQSSRDYPITVETPAGIAGVQGTSFGVNVGPDGKTGIATIHGTVAAQSQGREVLVTPGQYVVIDPGKAPKQPETAPKQAEFRLLNVKRVSAGAVRVVGQAHTLDLVLVNGRAVQTDAEGKFSVLVNCPLNRRIKFAVRGPAATETVYEIAVL